MPRLPSSTPIRPQGGACAEAMRETLLRARDQSVREFELAEEAGDRAKAAEARNRVRQAQALIRQYGLDR